MSQAHALKVGSKHKKVGLSNVTLKPCFTCCAIVPSCALEKSTVCALFGSKSQGMRPHQPLGSQNGFLEIARSVGLAL